MKLSVAVIALNEEKSLAKCLDSIKDLTDDIVVVDSGSGDKTVAIAMKFGARVFERRFDNYAGQKNFAVSKTSNEWILSLDGDEEISPKLFEEIKNIPESTEFDGFSIPRKNIILGKFIKYTRWQPELDRHIWLWKKGKGKWAGEIHEEVTVAGAVGKLKEPKIHYQYETVSLFVAMMNRYSQYDSEKRVKKGERFSFLRLIFDPLYNFVVRYFYRLGFLDGWRGFVLSYMMAIYHIEIWVKIWQKRR